MPASATTYSRIPSSRIGFKNILIATDFSAISTKALHYGLSIARSYHSKVHLVSIVSSMGFAMAGPEAVSSAVQLGLNDALALRGELKEGGFLEGVTSEIHVEYSSDVAKKLLEVIKKCQPDLVVLGTHGRTGFKKLWLGSVAEHVFRSSCCPVLTVGPHAHWPHAEKVSPQVLFPTDFSRESVAALHGCIDYAEAKGWGLMLLHIAPTPQGEAAIDRKRIVSSLESKLRDLLPADIAHRTHVRVEFGDVESTICAIAEEEHCSLIVMGLHSEKGLVEGRWQHAYHVVVDAPCPVLTVRAIPK